MVTCLTDAMGFKKLVINLKDNLGSREIILQRLVN
jgi:hypothetical protein